MASYHALKILVGSERLRLRRGLCGFWDASAQARGGAGRIWQGTGTFCTLRQGIGTLPYKYSTSACAPNSRSCIQQHRALRQQCVDFRRFAVGCKLRGASSNNAAAQCHSPPGSMHCPPAPDAQTYKNNETLHNNNSRTGTTSRGTQNLAKAQAERGPRLRGAARCVDGGD